MADGTAGAEGSESLEREVPSGPVLQLHHHTPGPASRAHQELGTPTQGGTGLCRQAPRSRGYRQQTHGWTMASRGCFSFSQHPGQGITSS